MSSVSLSSFSSPSGPVALGGGRAAPAPALAVAAAAAAAVVRAGRVLRVGCSAGADHAAVSAGVAVAPALVQVFAAFGPGGAGAVSSSAVAGVQAAAAAGASVSWWAGGGSAVPVRARLIRRSAAVLSGASVLLLVAPGSGSVAVARLALAAGLPVWLWLPPGAACPLPGSVPRAWLGQSWQVISPPTQPSLF